MVKLSIGQRLANGATVIASVPQGGDTSVVLAVWRGEFVVWTVDHFSTEAVNGSYFRPADYRGREDKALAAATSKLAERAGR